VKYAPFAASSPHELASSPHELASSPHEPEVVHHMNQSGSPREPLLGLKKDKERKDNINDDDDFKKVITKTIADRITALFFHTHTNAPSFHHAL